MAELLTENPSAGVTAPPPDALSQALYGDAAQPLNPANLAQQGTTGKALMAAMPDLVKGAGFATKGGNQPLTDATQITLRAQQAATDLRAATYQGFNSKSSVVKSMNDGFLNQFGALRTALTAPSIGEQIGQVLGQLNPDLTRSLHGWQLGYWLGIGPHALQPLGALTSLGPACREMCSKPRCSAKVLRTVPQTELSGIVVTWITPMSSGT